MTPLERITEMLRLASTGTRTFPPTIVYNEGWLLRLVLDWFSRQDAEEHLLNFAPDARWFSEALLPSQFFARSRGDPRAEGWTHADGVVGHVVIGDSALADTKLAGGGIQLIITEAKLFAPLSPGVKNARYFDQAARNVACIAEVLSRANRSPESLASLGFLLLAPAEQVARNLFERELSRKSIQDKVSRRVSEYTSPDRETKDKWQQQWFLPTLRHMKLECLSWEEIVDYIRTKDTAYGFGLSNFYSECLKFNRMQEPDSPFVQPPIETAPAPPETEPAPPHGGESSSRQAKMTTPDQMHKPGWGAVVLGEPMDLADWASVLNEPFDPWLEIHGAENVLRSKSLDELDSAGEVRDRAIANIDRLNGAMALFKDSRPLRFGGVIQFKADGSMHRTSFMEAGQYTLRPSRNVTFTITGPDGKPVSSSPPQPSEVQNWAVLADNEALLEDALTYFGRANDWFDIYQTLECLIMRFGGGSEREFIALGWAPTADIERLKRTANWARHAKRRFDPPSNPMEIGDARRLLGALLRRALTEASRNRA